MEEDKGNQGKNPSASDQNLEGKKPQGGGDSGGGWGGWGFSSFSVFSELQKAAEEISRNAVEVAKTAAKSVVDAQNVDSDSDSADGDGKAKAKRPSDGGGENEEEEKEKGEEEVSEADRLRKSALDRLEKASEDSLFGQGLKALDTSVETFATGAWSALGSALKGGASLVSKLEHSAANLADSIQHASLPVNATSLAPSILETGKSFTAKGIEVLERVGKETMDLIITETGLDLEKSSDEVDKRSSDEEQFEEVTFDRCFYIYGGPDQLEELEALSNHHALLFNRKKAKLPVEQKLLYDSKLKQIQQIFSMSSEMEENGLDLDKEKNVETLDIVSDIEMKKLRDSSVKKAADLAAGFTSALGGLGANDIIQRTTDRLETVHSEGIHRLSELCCFAVSQFLMLGKSVISGANKTKTEEEDEDEDKLKVDWPEDSIMKARIIRCKAQAMTGDVDTVSTSFTTGISDIVEAYLAAIQNASSDAEESLPHKKSIQEKASAITNRLQADGTNATEKIKDALQYLAYVVLSTSMATT